MKNFSRIRVEGMTLVFMLWTVTGLICKILLLQIMLIIPLFILAEFWLFGHSWLFYGEAMPFESHKNWGRSLNPSLVDL